MLYESLKLEFLLPSGQTGPGFFPAALSAALMLLGVLLGLVTLLPPRSAEPTEDSAGIVRKGEPRISDVVKAQEETAVADKRMLIRPFILWLLLVASVLLFKPLGFVISMALPGLWFQ